MRLNTDGTRDEEFGGDGSKRTNIGPFEDEAGSAIVQPDGKIVVAGSTRNLSVSGPDDFAIVRYLPGGRLDPSFGIEGIARSDFHSGLSERAGWSALQPDGKIVVVGLAFIRPTVGRSAVARYLG